MTQVTNKPPVILQTLMAQHKCSNCGEVTRWRSWLDECWDCQTNNVNASYTDEDDDLPVARDWSDT